MGIISLLDEECRMPKGSDESLLSKLHDTLTSNSFYIKPRTTKGQFGIKHYAGEVYYEINNFLDKNRSSIQDEIVELFQGSTVKLHLIFSHNSCKICFRKMWLSLILPRLNRRRRQLEANLRNNYILL